MECEVEVNALAPVASFAAGIAQATVTKSGQTALQSLLLEARDSVLSVSALNHSRAVTLRVPTASVGVLAPGAVLISAQKLTALLKANKGSSLFIQALGQHKVKLICGANSFTFATEAPGDFPRLTFGTAPTLQFSVSTLNEMLRRTAYAAHTQQSRMLFEGLCFHVEDGRFFTAATNGAMMAVCSAAGPENVTTQAVVNAQHVDGMGHLSDDALDIEITSHALILSGNKGSMRIARIEGIYPPFRSVIPPSFKEEIHFDRKKLAGLFKQLAPLTFLGTPRLKFAFTQGLLSLSAQGRDGDFHTEMEVGWQGEPKTLYYNPEFLSDAIDSMASDIVALKIVDELHPSVICENHPNLEVTTVFSPLMPGHE